MDRFRNKKYKNLTSHEVFCFILAREEHRALLEHLEQYDNFVDFSNFLLSKTSETSTWNSMAISSRIEGFIKNLSDPKKYDKEVNKEGVFRKGRLIQNLLNLFAIVFDASNRILACTALVIDNLGDLTTRLDNISYTRDAYLKHIYSWRLMVGL